MNIHDRCLDIYFRGILELAAMLPPPLAYDILPATGHLFRKWNTYDSGMKESAILMRALENIKDVVVLPRQRIRKTIEEYLRFESRFVIENIWLRKKHHRYILKCFRQADVDALKGFVRQRSYVIVTAHTSCIYMTSGLLHAVGHPNQFILMKMLNQSWNTASPLQRSALCTIPSWMNYQPLIFVEDGDSVGRGQTAIRAGQSIVIAPDVPGYDQRGVTVTLLGKQIRTGAGAAKIANKCGVPILIAIPWAVDCTEPYRIYFKEIKPSGNVASDMNTIYQAMETAIRFNPACWSGWLFLHRMLAT